MAGNAKTLVLVPTDFERRILESVADIGCQFALCGFGPIVAAARTAQLIETLRPDRVVLVGIAGAYDVDLPVGEARSFDEVACYGIGAGDGEQFESAHDMGWAQWSGDPTEAETGDAIRETLGLTIPDDLPNGGQLLTVTAASKTADDCSLRRRRFPKATSEDMEAFGVATACHLRSVSLTVIRGISNRAGDRDKSNWQIEPALNSASQFLSKVLQAD